MACILWMIVFHILNAGAQLFISPSDQSTLNNGAAIITCSCNSSCASITWMMNGKKITNDNPRWKVINSSDNRMSVLRIQPVRWRLDDGIYSCSGDGSVSDVAKISVHNSNDVPSDFPQLLHNIPLMEVTLEGVLVTCLSSGDSSILWFKDFLPVNTSMFYKVLSNNSILVTDIPQDGVKIECQVSNHRGSILSSYLSINSSVGTPTNLSYILVEGAVRLSWEVPKFLKSVFYYMVEYGDDINFKQEILNGDTQKFISTILEKGTEYKFTVSSKTVLGWSDKAVARIMTPDGIPLGSPLNITANDITSESFTLNWVPPQQKLRKGKIIVYEIRERADDKIIDWTVNSTETFYIIGNLQPQQSYSFQIRAYTSAGSGPWSSYIQINTKPQSSLQPPRAIKLHRLSPSELEVSWQAVPSNEPITYEIFATIHATSDLSEWQKRSTPTISIVFENAHSSSYAVRIRSVLPSGKFSELSKVVVETNSYFSDLNKYQTIGVGVRHFVVSLLKRGEHQDALVEWTPPDNIKFNHYQISYDGSKYYIDENNSKKEFIHKKTKKVDHILSKLKVENVHPGTLYKFMISTCFAEDICGTSQTVLLNTEPRIPPIPETPQIIQLGHEFSIMLRPVSGINGVILKYFLVILRSSLIENKTPNDFTNEEIVSNIQTFEGDIVNSSVVAFDFRTLPDRFDINNLSNEHNYVVFLRAFIDNNTFVSSEYSMSINFLSIKFPSKTSGNIDSKVMFTIIPTFVFIVVLVILMASCYRLKTRKTKKYKEFLKDEHVSLQSEKFISETSNFNKPSLNLSHSSTCRPINLKHIGKVLVELKMNEGTKLRKEYESIDPNNQFTWESSTKEENKSKNRYANVVAYDHTRVKITNEITGNDYINANYIDGYCKTRTYIATQGPMNNTRADFWIMIWEQKSRVIVMLSNIMERNRIKCDQYWPQTAELYGMIYVSLNDTIIFSTYVIRTFQITNVNTLEKRVCTQYQFTEWPDQGTPLNSSNFLNFVKRIKMSEHLYSTPLVVHCSAGVGRTGVFIGTDVMLEQMKYEEVIDIYAYVTLMRSQRNYMIQTEEQYKFLYEVISEETQYGDREVTADRFLLHVNKIFTPLHSRSGNSEVQMEYKKLQTLFETLSLKPVRCLILDEENKFGHLQEAGLHDYPACLVNSYKIKRAFLATESPQSATTDDFWRKMWDINSTIIVLIENTENNGKMNPHQYWPEGRSIRYKYFVLDPVAQYNMPMYTLREFKMTDARDGQSRVVRHFHYTGWTNYDIPMSGESFIEFIGQIQKTKQQFGLEGPIAIHCSQGDDKTGVFIAVNNVLERLQYEGIINVFQSIRSIRSQIPSFNASEEQYRFCYQAVLEYLSSFDHLIS